ILVVGNNKPLAIRRYCHAQRPGSDMAQCQGRSVAQSHWRSSLRPARPVPIKEMNVVVRTSGHVKLFAAGIERQAIKSVRDLKHLRFHGLSTADVKDENILV